MIYADHAATTPLDEEVVQVVAEAMCRNYGNPSGIHSVSTAARHALGEARERVAQLLGAAPREIIFTGGGTESNNLAVTGLARRFAAPSHVITSQIEHASVLKPIQRLEKQGYQVTYLPPDEHGRILPEALRSALRDNTVLVSIMAANNEVGTLQRTPELAAVAHEAGALFHTDAVQAVGKLACDVEAWDVDALSLSAHKFYGPKGVGALYLRHELKIEPLVLGGGQEQGLRSGTENLPSILGLARALERSVSAQEQEWERQCVLRDELVKRLLAIPDCMLTGHPSERLPGLASVVFRGVEGQALVILLDKRGVAASTGSACSSSSQSPSHVLKALGLPNDFQQGSLRLSLGKATTLQDVERIAQAVEWAVGSLRAQELELTRC